MNPESTLRVQSSLKQAPLLSDASTSALQPWSEGQPQTQGYGSMGEGDTHTQTHSHTHTAQRYSLCMSDCAPVRLDFYVSWFKSPLRSGCSVSSRGFSRSWQSVTPMFTGISSVLFLLCSVFTLWSCFFFQYSVMSFSCFASWSLLTKKTVETREL